MFKTIFKYELKYWLKQPSIYIYAFILFALAFVTMTGMASEPPKRFNSRIVNAPLFLYDMTKKFMLIAFFLVPAVLGVSACRDFNSNMHTLLFAYPFQKRPYLLAKFISAFLIFIGISGLLFLGYVLGSSMPWVSPELVQGIDPIAYGQLIGLFFLPNLLLVSVIVFGVVVLSRNAYAGYAAVLIFVLIPQIIGFVFGSDLDFWRHLLDPMGTKAIESFTQNWTVLEKNSLLLPMEHVWLYNRLLWTIVALLLFSGITRYFELTQTASPILNRFNSNNKLSPTFSYKGMESSSKRNIDNEKTSVLGQITKVKLPDFQIENSLTKQLRSLWKVAQTDFRFILTSPMFLSLVVGGLVFVLLVMSNVNPRWETETYPMTWQILELPSQFFSGVINLITFLYAGLLIHRERSANMNQLMDITPVPNWVLLGGKFLAIIKMQCILLLIVMVSGIITQAYKGFYHFEIDQYLFNLFGLNLIHFVIWAMLAMFVQSLFNNPYLGFFLLLFVPIGFIGIAEFGPQFLGLDFLEQEQFRYNQAPGGVFGLRYSDLDGYGPQLLPYFLYKLYWVLAGVLLLIGAFLFWTRGLPQSFRERLTIARQRFSSGTAMGFISSLLVFISMGFVFYYETNIESTYFTRTEKRNALSAAEKKYERYEFYAQPKIVSIKVNMDIFPSTRSFQANGSYWIVNKTNALIDTLIINYKPHVNTTYEFNQAIKNIQRDTIADLLHFDIVTLTNSLAQQDSIQMTFKSWETPPTALSPHRYVKENGTFLEDDMFPRLGNYLSFARSHYRLGNDDRLPHPADSTARQFSFMAKDADYVAFEAIVSTAKDQIAIAPGHLIRDWTVDNRRYFHYEIEPKMASTYLFMSGNYKVARDQWKDVDLAIYYDDKHPYNIERIMAGMKAGLAYCSENFSPYQFKQLSTIEFSQTGQASAHGFPSTLPTGEGAGFIAHIDDSEEGGTDYAFGTAVHETAHQWWGHQIIPADALGSKMITESLSEYVNIMVKKKEKGVDKMRNYLGHNRDMYFEHRMRDRRPESPLMYAYHSQNYIHYPKGALVFYALSDYLGEQNLNTVIKKYVEKVAFQEEAYTTSIELVDFIQQATPDSLQYLITDFFETVTLWDNQLINWSSTPLPNGKYQVDIEVAVSKYRSGLEGKKIYSENGVDSLSHALSEKEILHSLPLTDYIEVGVFGEDEKELYLQKHLFQQVDNQLSIIVDTKPEAVAIDPYFKLIEVEIEDNFK